MTVQLPPFPVDDSTLDLLWTAIHPDPDDTERSSVGDLCVFYSQMAGSDPAAVEESFTADTITGLAEVSVMRDPSYHPNDILAAVIAEVRRLRAELATRAPA